MDKLSEYPDPKCSMPNMNAFRPVVHEKILKMFCYINLYKNMFPYGMAICDPRDDPC